ncbi:SlyX family protein [Opacimonas viscosa]|uniref:Protein SlyX homolog n=1 Tax=Opacimonas viscosa TaxID=2961944 RepID=A0AA41X509_9ALTE|nr:SlyX family protein [Opacimonas viscosa]MCP3429613.1 SlyX family protein [Opacimonas viscosa]
MTENLWSQDPSSLIAQLQKTIETLENQVVDLETKVAFQDDTIEQLNEALSNQQLTMDQLSFKVDHMMDKMKSIEPSNIAKPEEETPPPHY